MVAAVGEQRAGQQPEFQPASPMGSLTSRFNRGVNVQPMMRGEASTVNAARNGMRKSNLILRSSLRNKCKSNEGPISTVDRRSGMPLRSRSLRTGVVTLKLRLSSTDPD